MSPIRLRSMADMNTAAEDLYNRIMNEKIPPKLADAANTTLKTIFKMNVEFPMKYATLAAKSKGAMPLPIPWLEGALRLEGKPAKS